MWYDKETMYSQVKGVDICINDEVWLTVADCTMPESQLEGAM